MDLKLQIHWENEWHDAGLVQFPKPEEGLLGLPRFSYSAQYALKALDYLGDFDTETLIDRTAVGVNLPCHFGGDYLKGQIAPVLRDIIPQGASRRLWVKLLGYDRDPGAALDTQLLAEGCIAPIGNLRIKEAATAFSERLAKSNAVFFTREEICTRADALIEHAQALGIAVGGATGAGGDAPKLLLVETDDGRFALEGTIEDHRVRQHWLVKFPRGQKLQADIDVLIGEAAIYQSLEDSLIESINLSRLDQIDGRYALWLPRFDRELANGSVVRHGMESVYSMMEKIGDGAALSHPAVFKRLQSVLTRPASGDEILADYLARDIVNTVFGNSDNHGRNIALIKRGRDLELAPGFDIAPMVLDPEGIARVTRWPEEYCSRPGVPDYPAILESLAEDPTAAADVLTRKLESLGDIEKKLREYGAPQSMLTHPGVKPDFHWTVIEALSKLSTGSSADGSN